jgi:hypothetical protein
MGAKLFPRSLYHYRQSFLPVGRAQAHKLNPKGSSWTLLLSAITVAFVLIVPTTAIVAEAQTNRMVVEYVPPTNPAHEALYKRLMERRPLEKLQEVFSPFRLPVELKLRIVGC